MKRVNPLILTAVILLSASVISSCGETASGVPDVSDVPGSDVTETETETEEIIHYQANVPTTDFGGAAFRVAGVDPSYSPTHLLNFDEEEETGDVVLDAIFRRNRTIEETYNIVFETKYVPSWSDCRPFLKPLVMSGDSTYQLCMLICREAFPAMLDGLCLPYSEIPYLDFSQPWYIHNVNEAFSVDGKTILAYTDECMNAYMQTVCTFFNKNTVAEYDLEDPYQLVRNGNWTMDAFYKMTTEAIKDVDGNGDFDTNDNYGVVGESDWVYPVWVGCGLSLIEKDKDDLPVYTAPGNERMINVLTDLADHLGRKGFFINTDRDLEGREDGIRFFTDGHVLFSVTVVGSIVSMRNMSADFGVLPLPKYDENQEQYYSRMVDGWIHIVPNTEQDVEMVGTVLEALGAETKNYVIPAFFDIALGGKYTRDTDSEEMLDMVFNNVRIDLGDTIYYEDARLNVTNYLDTKGSDFVSMFSKFEKQINKTLQKTIDSVRDNDELLPSS